VKARVTVMLKDGVLDPQGRAIAQALKTLGFDGVNDVRAGKIIELDLDAADTATAKTLAADMARQLLANEVIERFSVEVA
jgi:phosphoribosylformylglycinamidine synthase